VLEVKTTGLLAVKGLCKTRTNSIKPMKEKIGYVEARALKQAEYTVNPHSIFIKTT